MNSEQYLKSLKEGSLIDRLRFMAKEYDGPCGQSSTVIAANAAKKGNLLEAITHLEETERFWKRFREAAGIDSDEEDTKPKGPKIGGQYREEDIDGPRHLK